MDETVPQCTGLGRLIMGDMSNKMADDIIELQSQLAFQQAAIDEMHITIARQDNDIATLTDELRKLKIQLNEMTPSGMDASTIETPPHY